MRGLEMPESAVAVSSGGGWSDVIGMADGVEPLERSGECVEGGSTGVHEMGGVADIGLSTSVCSGDDDTLLESSRI